MNIANFKKTYFEKHLRTAASDSSYIHCIENWIKLFRNQIGLLFLLKHKITLFYLLSFVFIHFVTRCHSLPLIVIFCDSLSFVVTRCHSLPFVVTWSTTPCHSLYYSLSLVFIGCATRSHSLSLDVRLVCLFINDLKKLVTSLVFKDSNRQNVLQWFILICSF